MNIAVGIFMRLASTLLFAFAILASAATADDAKAPDAKTELQAAIDLLKTHHMNSAKMDWPAIEAHSNAMIADAKTAEDAYPAIKYIVQKLGEKHTWLQPANWAKAQAADTQVGDARPPDVILPEGHLLEGHIGLITVPAYLGSANDNIAYAHAGRSTVQRFASAHICRYVIDLRGDGGGDMYTMMNGISALLGPEPYGYWQQTGSAKDVPWRGMANQFISPKDIAIKPQKLALLAKDPVAVLIDRDTGSSGEFIAMAFEGRTNIRVFGEPSAGYITVNTNYPLPDGAVLYVSGGWATDRLHRDYRQRIVPDEQTDRGQATLDGAVAWLKHQPCRG